MRPARVKERFTSCCSRLVEAPFLCDSEQMDKHLSAPAPIYLAATPIGNVEDASPRLVNALQTADIVAAEDTRRLLNLAGRLGVEVGGKIVAFHDHNEQSRVRGLLDASKAGQMVLVVSDAGTPTVSDPGYHLARAAWEEGVPVSPLPGPSAALAALSVSGLPTDRFIFEGFLPRKQGQATKVLEELEGLGRTMIFFESPRRLAKTLDLLGKVLGGAREAAVCRELTKTYEEVLRGSLQNLAEAAAEDEVRGEITIVVSGEGAAQPLDLESAANEALKLAEAEGLRLKKAAAQVASKVKGLGANSVYDQALELKNR